MACAAVTRVKAKAAEAINLIIGASDGFEELIVVCLGQLSTWRSRAPLLWPRAIGRPL